MTNRVNELLSVEEFQELENYITSSLKEIGMEFDIISTRTLEGRIKIVEIKEIKTQKIIWRKESPSRTKQLGTFAIEDSLLLDASEELSNILDKIQKGELTISV